MSSLISPAAAATPRTHQTQFVRNKKTSASSTVNARSTLNSVVAGYVAGMSGIVVGHPFDSLKVWLQTNSTGANKHLGDSVHPKSLFGRPSAAVNTPQFLNSIRALYS